MHPVTPWREQSEARLLLMRIQLSTLVECALYSAEQQTYIDSTISRESVEQVRFPRLKRVQCTGVSEARRLKEHDTYEVRTVGRRQ